MKKQAFNPYLPSYEYIPDGEPRVYDGRVYVFGSHDKFNGKLFCLNDYVLWSAPLDDLGNFTYHGVIYKKDQDPNCNVKKDTMYAPDCIKGIDGRFYLYYGLNDSKRVSVAVADKITGPYEFYGYVHYKDGTNLGEKEGDYMPFDPGILVDDDKKVYLYVGQGNLPGMDSKKPFFRYTNYVVRLDEDMITVLTEPKFLTPSRKESKGTSFEGREFFEASSIRKFNNKYYFIYSSVLSHELCYAISDYPDKDFVFKGALVDNGDCGIDGRPLCSPFDAKTDMNKRNYIGNTHGSIAYMNDNYYIFYHRQTNRHMFSRQGCAEKLVMNKDGTFNQACMTSCGLNDGPLVGVGTYEARIACNLYSKKGATFSMFLTQNGKHPVFTQDEEDGKEVSTQHIANMKDGATAVFKYFDLNKTKGIEVSVRGKAKGTLDIYDENNSLLASIEVNPNNKKNYVSYKGDFKATSSKELYFIYHGKGYIDFYSFTLD